MIIQSVIGNATNLSVEHLAKDFLTIEWYEATQRVLRKKTTAGVDIAMRFLQKNHQLHQNDIVYLDENLAIIIQISPCKCLIIEPTNTLQLANICYEIGNKHLPLFINNNQLLAPFDAPLQKQLLSQGYIVVEGMACLINPLKTSVAPHGNNSASLFSKIMKLTNQND